MNGYSENIYNLIPKEEARRTKPPKHESKFRSTIKDENASQKFAHKTMGEAEVKMPRPNEYLKKGEFYETQLAAGAEERKRQQQLQQQQEQQQEQQQQQQQQRRPPVPKASDPPPVMGIKTKKNFISQNAVENILSVPKKPEKNHVDTRKGDKFPLPPSGLEPVYRNRRDYGEVPEYLKKRAEEIARAQDEYDNYVREMQRRGAMQQLSAEEREAIICGLKKNWEDLHHQYQSLSVMTDTIPKKHRKEKLEKEMKDLERDIELMERHQVIYLAN